MNDQSVLNGVWKRRRLRKGLLASGDVFYFSPKPQFVPKRTKNSVLQKREGVVHSKLTAKTKGKASPTR